LQRLHLLLHGRSFLPSCAAREPCDPPSPFPPPAIHRSLPTIGRKRASLIAETRAASGPFASVSDLSRIGLSEKQGEKLLAAYSAAVASGKLALAAARARKSL